MKTCQVCISEYTDIKRKPVTCPGCQYTACTTCIRNYFLTTTDVPHCLNCRRAWNRSFLYEQLPKSFVDGDLKEHRYKTIFDREKSLMPATQEYVQYEMESRRRSDENETLHLQEQELQRQWNAVQHQIAANKTYILRVAQGQDPNVIGNAPTANTEKRTFIAACPTEDCRGFLSTAYKCGTCSKQFCSKCRELKGEEGHMCDPNLVETIAAIVKDSRSCPSCGIPISKVHGCDQMFCTQCDTAFSYTTGQIQRGAIHNPHYFERMAQLGADPVLAGQVAQRAQEGGCANWPNYYELRRLTTPVLTSTVVEDISFILQTGIHVEQVELPKYQPIHATETQDLFRKLRVKYLMHDMTEREFSMAVQRTERAAEKAAEIREVLELYVITTMECIINIQRTAGSIENDRVKKRSKIENIVQKYWTFMNGVTNKALRAIGDLYNNQITQFVTREELKDYNNEKNRNQWRNSNGFVHNYYKPSKDKKNKKDEGDNITHV